MKKVSIRLFVLLSLMNICATVASQNEVGFAGEDKAVYFDPVVGSANVVLGKYDYLDEVYYIWDTWVQPDGGYCEIDDYRTSNPWVQFFVPGEYIFRCLQISKYGYRSEFVAVNVLSKVELIDVKVKNQAKCFTDFYPLSRDDFEFVTYPPDCEKYIRLAPPDILMVPEDSFWPFQIQEVEFMSIDENGDDYKCDITCKIPVVNKNKFISIDEMSKDKIDDIDAEMEQHMDKLEESMGGLSRIKCFTDPNYLLPPVFTEVVVKSENGTSTSEVLVVSAQVKNTGWAAWALVKSIAECMDKLGNMKTLLPITFDVGSKLDQLGIKMSCYEGNIYPEIYYSGSFSVSLGFSIDAPLPYLSVPKVGGIHARGAFTATAKIENKTQEPLNPLNGNLKIPIQFAVEPAIGLSALLFDADVLSAAAVLKTPVEVESYLNFNSMLKDSYCEECWKLSDNSCELNKISLKVSVELSVVLMGFTMKKETYDLLEVNTKDELLIFGEK